MAGGNEDPFDLAGERSQARSFRGCNSPSASSQKLMAEARRNFDMQQSLEESESAGTGSSPAPQSSTGSGAYKRPIGDLTYVILYEFLPAAINILVPETGESPTSENTQMAAAAAMALATLMGFPVGFLEYLLCIPWANFSKKPGQGFVRGAGMPGQFQVSQEECKRLINTPISPLLMDTFVDFLFSNEQNYSLPSILRQAQSDAKGENTLFVQRAGPTRESVAALLDGATPLHCAALRGDLRQVQQLLKIGASAYVRTAAGELPLEFVPVCGETHCSCPWPHPSIHLGAPGTSESARNMRHHGYGSGGAVRECLSRDTRNLLARKTIAQATGGVWAWFKMTFFCILCVLGLWGQLPSLMRPSVEQHAIKREDDRRQKARNQAQGLMDKMRSEVSEGFKHLNLAKVKYRRKARNSLRDPGGAAPGSATSFIRSVGGVGGQSGLVLSSSTGEEEGQLVESLSEHAEKAFESFVRAVHACQSLELRGGTLPRGLSDLNNLGGRNGKDPPQTDAHVMEDEQAILYDSWAQAVLFKYRSCRCLGCYSLAAQATRMAHVQVVRLFRRVERKKRRAMDRWLSVGRRLASIIYTRACFLLDTSARKSATKEAIQQAEQCLKDWDTLETSGLTKNGSFIDESQDCLAISCLREWAAAGMADLQLAEALLGQELMDSKICLTEILMRAVQRDPKDRPFLKRAVSTEVASQLEAAMSRIKSPSAWVLKLVQDVTSYAACEVKAAAALRDVMNKKSSEASAPDAIHLLSAAIESAREFPNLATEVEAAASLKERCQQRAHVIALLEAAMHKVRQPMSGEQEEATARGKREGAPLCKEAWLFRAAYLQKAIKEAQEASVSVSKAKRLLRDLQSCANAAEAIGRLTKVLDDASGRQAGSGALKSAMMLAEEVAGSLTAISAADSGGVAEAAELSEMLKELMGQVRNRLERKKAAEGLARVHATCKAVSDLPKLESAILAARKVGAEELDMATYQSASELRGKLAEASRLKIALAEKLRALLGRTQRSAEVDESLADSVEAAITDAEGFRELLDSELRDAREQLDRWRSAGAATSKLERVLGDGTAPGALSRAIQEASAAGVKVAEAKRVLKQMNALEGLLFQASEVQSGVAAATRTKLLAAESAGVRGPLLAGGKARLARLLAREAKEILDAAMKPRGDIARSADVRRSALQSALDRAQDLLEQQTELVEAAQGILGPEPDAGEDSDSSSNAPTLSIGGIDAVARRELAEALSEERECVEVAKAVTQAVEAAAREQERVETERQLAEKEKREKAERDRAEKESRDKERKERSEAERAARDKAEREKKERGRLVAEAADRQRRLQIRKEKQAERQQAAMASRPPPPPPAPQQPTRVPVPIYTSRGNAPQSAAPQRPPAPQAVPPNPQTWSNQPYAQPPAQASSVGRERELNLPASIMPSTTHAQYQYAPHQGAGMEGVSFQDLQQQTQPVEASWSWDPESMLPSDIHLMETMLAGTHPGVREQQEVLLQQLREGGQGLEGMKKVESWSHLGELEMLAKDVLDKLEDPEWDSAREAAEASGEEALLDTETQGQQQQQQEVVGDLPSVPSPVVEGSDAGSEAPSNGGPLLLDTSRGYIEDGGDNSGFGSTDGRSTHLGASVGGLPLAGMDYGGANMWGMSGGGGLPSCQPMPTEFLLPSDLGLGGMGGGEHSMWGTGGLGSGTGPSLFNLPVNLDEPVSAPQSTGSLGMPGLSWEHRSSSGGGLGGLAGSSSGSNQGRPPSDSMLGLPSGSGSDQGRDKKPVRPAGRVLRVPRICRYHLQGFCRDGANCRFAHETPQYTAERPAGAPPAPPAVPPPPPMAKAPSGGHPNQQFRAPPPPPARPGSGNDVFAPPPAPTSAAASSAASAHGSSSKQGCKEESDLCCVCLEQPREIGLAHENGVLHCCVCRECAEQLTTKGFNCPLCMERITQFVHRIYM